MEDQQGEKVEQEEPETQSEAVDLNRVFREEDVDLNAMFPDGEMRKFLRQVKRNSGTNQRFLEGFVRERLFEEDE